MARSRGSVAVWLLAFLPAGCGGAGGLEGTVEWDGTPVAEGFVGFEPADGGGPTFGGPVAAGRFAVPAPAGLRPGPLRVRIQAVRSLGGPAPASMGSRGTFTENFARLPERYNHRTELTVRFEAGQIVRCNFSLRSDPQKR